LLWFCSCDSIEKITGKIQHLRDEMKDPAKFKEIYRFGFHFAKEDADKKVLRAFNELWH